nr:MAG TPA: hypothetical protein [Caudoviricetes sp.]
MIPINDYQKKIYEALSSTGYKVFDEVPVDEELPLIAISDYTLSDGVVKSESYTISQTINIYSEYEGKKEINEMVSVTLDKLKSLVNVNITDTFFIADIRLLESSVSRNEESFYMANLNIQFELEGE